MRPAPALCPRRSAIGRATTWPQCIAAALALLLAVGEPAQVLAQQMAPPPAAPPKPVPKVRANAKPGPAAPVGSEQVPRGQSRELGIEFEVDGGSDWCRADPVVRLKAANRASFRPRDVPFQQMIGRIRAVVAGQCSIIERLTFQGIANGASVFMAETSKHTHWRHMIVIDATTGLPQCLFGQEGHPDCARRAKAYLVARQALNPIVLPDLELTTLLDPRTPVHLTWRAGGAMGKLTVAEGDQLADYFDNANALAQAYIEELSEACTNKDGTLAEQWILDGFKEITLGGFECRNGAARETSVVVVAGTATGFDAFSLAAPDIDPESVKSMGWGIALAIKDRGW